MAISKSKISRVSALAVLLLAGLAYLGTKKEDSAIHSSQTPQPPLEQLATGVVKALQDPKKVKLMECMGVRVFKEPQSSKHSPSGEECRQVKSEANIPEDAPPMNTSSSAAPDIQSPLKAFLTEMRPPQTNITLASFAVMCGLRSDEWFQPIMASYQQFARQAANRHKIGNEGLDAADAQANEITAKLRSIYTCTRLTNSEAMREVDAIRDVLSGGYR